MSLVKYNFLLETYETEILKTLSVWSMFDDDDLPLRPHTRDVRGRSIHEQMVHQCLSEDVWFRTMFGVDLKKTPLPEEETRLGFILKYADDAHQRMDILQQKKESWWEENTDFFEVKKSRTWIFTRRLTHSAHHRGQLVAMLRMLNKDVYSTYGPTSDTGGLMQHRAPTIYAYPDLATLIKSEKSGGSKSELPGTGGKPTTERPD